MLSRFAIETAVFVILFDFRQNKHFDNKFSTFTELIKKFSEVAIYFNLKGHNFKNDLKFHIYKKKFENFKDRLSLESDLINIFLSLNMKIIDAKIPSTYSISKLSFT